LYHQGVGDKKPASAAETEERLRRMRAISDRVAALPLIDDRSLEELLGYDEHGLPSRSSSSVTFCPNDRRMALE